MGGCPIAVEDNGEELRYRVTSDRCNVKAVHGKNWERCEEVVEVLWNGELCRRADWERRLALHFDVDSEEVILVRDWRVGDIVHHINVGDDWKTSRNGWVD